ncbi:hypothetical protein B0H17DRAFT_1152502 [Mycena rosella]|uniref:Uncharacterized protein n=1 Tax=Mycena rosella TaxID=1033263 RepID=A0AAD7BCN4_MYCRO|nr:hypothetical protein B0H17DRAFT_1152502 [Mycena rosella]
MANNDPAWSRTWNPHRRRRRLVLFTGRERGTVRYWFLSPSDCEFENHSNIQEKGRRTKATTQPGVEPGASAVKAGRFEGDSSAQDKEVEEAMTQPAVESGTLVALTHTLFQELRARTPGVEPGAPAGMLRRGSLRAAGAEPSATGSYFYVIKCCVESIAIYDPAWSRSRGIRCTVIDSLPNSRRAHGTVRYWVLLLEMAERMKNVGIPDHDPAWSRTRGTPLACVEDVTRHTARARNRPLLGLISMHLNPASSPGVEPGASACILRGTRAKGASADRPLLGPTPMQRTSMWVSFRDDCAKRPRLSFIPVFGSAGMEWLRRRNSARENRGAGLDSCQFGAHERTQNAKT